MGLPLGLSSCTWPWQGHTLSSVFSVGPSRKVLTIWSVSREGQQSCEGTGTQVLWGVAEGTGIVQSGEEQVQGKPHHSTTS